MYKDFMFYMKKYSKEMDDLWKVSFELIKCNKQNCKKEFEELSDYRKKVIEKFRDLMNKEEKTEGYKKNDLNIKNIIKDYRNKKVVVLYLYNIKESIPNDIKTTKGYKREFKIYQKKIKQNLKVYLKTEEKKYYTNETKKILNVIDSQQYINLSKCSYEKCLELHKKDFTTVKNFTKILCKDKNEKSCKIYKMIDKLDFTKITYKDTIEVVKLIKKGIF